MIFEQNLCKLKHSKKKEEKRKKGKHDFLKLNDL